MDVEAPEILVPTCAACGTVLPDDGNGPILECPQCRKVNWHLITVDDPDLHRPRHIKQSMLGKAVGQYSWCDHCQALTENAPGKTYLQRPLDAVLLDELRPWTASCLQRLHPASASDDEVRARFFGCRICGQEQFWRSGYGCDRCGSMDSYLIRSYAFTSYSSQDYVGLCLNWTDDCLCRHCWSRHTRYNGNP